MRIVTIITALLFTFGCTLKGADQDGADTQIGDDGFNGGTGDTGFDEPDPVEDHGLADRCVDRAIYWSTEPWKPDSVSNIEYNVLDIQTHERWYEPRSIPSSWLNFSADKPNPLGLSETYCPESNWHWLDDFFSETPNEYPTCLVSGYHLQAPAPGLSGVMPPGPATMPYSVDLIIDAAWPAYSMRHTWAAPACCVVPATPEEVIDSPAWQFAQQHRVIPTNTHADCQSYVVAIGINPDEMGIPLQGNPDAVLDFVADRARCLSNGGKYTPLPSAIQVLAALGAKAGLLGTGGDSGRIYTFPFVFNYEWAKHIASFVDWDSLIVQFAQYTGIAAVIAKLGITQAALVNATWWVINNLYLPPEDFEHARYGVGGGCYFSATVFYDEPSKSWFAGQTCPRGFYGDFEVIDLDDHYTGELGYAGSCTVDGLDVSPLGGGLNVLSPSPVGSGRTFVVNDIEAFGAMLDESGGVISGDIFGAISDAVHERAAAYASNGLTEPVDGPPINVGDSIVWASSPGGTMGGYGDSLARSLGYDDVALSELASALGWSLDRAHAWIDEQGIGTVADALRGLADGVPQHLLDRTTVSLRQHHAWHMRVVTRDGLMVQLHFIG